MPTKKINPEDLREHPRNLVRKPININSGLPFQGGVLYDASVGGVCVKYPENIEPVGRPLEVGDILFLTMDGKTVMGSEVVRVFDGGFATKYDHGLDKPRPSEGLHFINPSFQLTAEK